MREQDERWRNAFLRTAGSMLQLAWEATTKPDADCDTCPYREGCTAATQKECLDWVAECESGGDDDE
jgi:hypothetical protein